MDDVARGFLPLAVFLMCTTQAVAQPVADHLKCYKIKDPQAKARYTADLGGLVAEPGCKITVPAVTACVPATKANVNPRPPGTGGTGTPNAFGCYKIKCPKASLPALQLNDQFGSRSVTPRTPTLLCAPMAPVTTTTTTTVTSTTNPCASVTCTASDQCHVAGTCDPATGQCSNPDAPNGTACTCPTGTMSTCQNGTCVCT